MDLIQILYEFNPIIFVSTNAPYSGICQPVGLPNMTTKVEVFMNLYSFFHDLSMYRLVKFDDES